MIFIVRSGASSSLAEMPAVLKQLKMSSELARLFSFFRELRQSSIRDFRVEGRFSRGSSIFFGVKNLEFSSVKNSGQFFF